MKAKIKGTDLIKWGIPEGPMVGKLLAIVHEHYSKTTRRQLQTLLKRLMKEPAFYKSHEVLGSVAVDAIDYWESQKQPQLLPQGNDYKVYGVQGIEQGAINQMEIAMKLPVSKAGALMADAHQGYGLPIGGVLATENAVIPYGVGMDIGCRMCLSVYDLPRTFLDEEHHQLKQMLVDHTRFGRANFKNPIDHEVLTRPEFQEISVVRALKDKAYQQIGTSGGGNHFVEFGLVEVDQQDQALGLPTGKYLALLSHSGSRGLGANIAQHYTKVAMKSNKLPVEARHLAWLDLNSEAGQEYWLAMNLAGDYASACHHQIHARIGQALGEEHLVMVENHHNFAWKEQDAQGGEYVVHRKGATPAGEGVLGVIPGSMTSPGFIVQGKGDKASINSASHGAGRLMSRSKAKSTLKQKDVRKFIKQAGIDLIGSGIDEAPMVYKDIHQVMAHQTDLVEVLGAFYPRIVRMCGE